MSRAVKCRYCGQTFKKEEVDWIMPSKNFYYHTNCWLQKEKTKKQVGVQTVATDEQWYKYTKDFLKKDLKIYCNWPKITTQRSSLKKKGFTDKGIYLSLCYYYNVMKGDPEKAEGGIGIVPYIYEEAEKYWREQYKKQKTILESLEKQKEQMENREEIVIKKNNANKPRWKSKIEEIGEMTDE